MWFVFDGEQVGYSGVAARIGPDAPAILAELGYSSEYIKHLIQAT